jgi:hypothetical protein
MNPAPSPTLVPHVINLLGVAFDEKYAPYQRMANVIIKLTRKHGDCLPQDLLPFGFSKADLDERWHLAHAMANVELRLMEQSDASNPQKRVHFKTV